MNGWSNRWPWILGALAALTVAVPPTWGQTSSAPAAPSLRITRIALFKHGYGFVERSQTIPTNQPVRALVPPASNGTFWIELDDRDAVSLSAKTERVQVEERFVPTDVEQLLLAAEGERVNIWLSASDALAGTVRLVVQRDPKTGLVASRLAVLEQDDGETFAFTPGQLQRISFPKGSFPTESTRVRTEDQIVATIGSERLAETTLRVQHIADGISWVPSYIIELQQSDRARVTCKALIVNDMEDLDDVDVELVVGFPNLEYAEIRSPFLPSQTLANFLQEMTHASHRGQSDGSGALFNTMSQAAAYGHFAPPSAGFPTEADGSSVEDMFFYRAGRVSLRKGERAYQPLFAAACDAKHIYEWEIVDYVDDSSRFRQIQPGAEETVWHSIALLNETANPWTTAAAMVIDKGRPLSQDTLGYTPAGGTGTVRLTKALGVRPVVRERQLEGGERGTVRIWNRNYELVTVEGEVEVENTLKKDVAMEVTKYLSGEIIRVDGEPTVVTITAGLRRVNASRKVLWCPTIKAGEKWNAKYQYKVLIDR